MNNKDWNTLTKIEGMRRGAFPSRLFNISLKTVGIILVAIFFIVPIIRLVMMSFTTEEGFSLQYYQEILQDQRTWQVLKNTLIIVTGSTIIAFILGTFFAWIVAYTDIRMKRLSTIVCFFTFCYSFLYHLVGMGSIFWPWWINGAYGGFLIITEPFLGFV
ncbi:hypothetical protein PD280_04680 [Virgibacillus salarius]|uniref:hypothetical protein n=1 Tax=Virgibacillus salarius TaxID=447199 RepID=UPI002491BB35|nr:hypothetical protein [Virgibacillus salarius]WBX81078.1 hypothetical protein PD280_04680 [Virgibacillus salarius]